VSTGAGIPGAYGHAVLAVERLLAGCVVVQPDYFGRWKALHYAARRFYAPLLLSIEDAPRVSRSSQRDLREAWQGSVRWR